MIYVTSATDKLRHDKTHRQNMGTKLAIYCSYCPLVVIDGYLEPTNQYIVASVYLMGSKMRAIPC